MEKQVTSSITQLSLGESLEKSLGRQVLACFSLIRSSILVMKELHLRWTGATLGLFLFWVSWNIISWIFTRRNICLSSGSLFIGSQRLIKKRYFVSQSSGPLPIDCIRYKFLPFNLYHRFLQWALSTPGPRPSLSRRPRRLRRCWCVYWIVSRREFSNEIVVSTSAAVFFRFCWLPIKLLRLKLQVAFHFSSIRSTFFKKVTS